MATVTVTFEAGAQTETLTIPDATVARALGMVEEYYIHPNPDATLLQKFAAGLRRHFLRDLFDWERRAARLRVSDWNEPDLEGGTDGAGGEEK